MNLRLEPATLEDIPDITELWFIAFNDPVMRELVPNTPGVRDWFSETNRMDMVTKSYQKYMKVVDLNTPGDRPKLVAYAKWDTSMPDIRGPRFAPWHSEQPADKCDKLFGGMDERRRKKYGDRKHFYLDMLCTHPDYRRCGAASMLISWGCELANKEGAGAYIDASEEGVPLYEKFGFVNYSDGDEIGLAPMMRDQNRDMCKSAVEEDE